MKIAVRVLKAAYLFDGVEYLVIFGANVPDDRLDNICPLKLDLNPFLLGH